MSDLIQQLKDNEKPFGLMSEEMQEKASQDIANEDFLMWFGKKWSAVYSGFLDSNTYRLRPDYAEEPEVVECAIKPQGDHWHYRDGGTWFSLHEAYDRQTLIGFKFAGYSDIFNESTMYEWNGKLYREVQLDWILSGKAKVLHATHVLFRRQT